MKKAFKNILCRTDSPRVQNVSTDKNKSLHMFQPGFFGRFSQFYHKTLLTGKLNGWITIKKTKQQQQTGHEENRSKLPDVGFSSSHPDFYFMRRLGCHGDSIGLNRSKGGKKNKTKKVKMVP